MKKIKILFLILSLVLAITCCFVMGCKSQDKTDNGSEDGIVSETGTSLLLNAMSIPLEKLESFDVVATVNGEEVTDVVWKSTNEAVATVNNGKVLAVSEGDAVIIATFDDAEARCSVHVTDNKLIPVVKTNIIGHSLAMFTGKTFNVESSVYYNNKLIDDAAVEFDLECTDGSVEIYNGVITAVKEGSAILTVYSEWSGLTCSEIYTVDVVCNMVAQLASVHSVSLYNDTGSSVQTFDLVPVCYENGQKLNKNQYEIVAWNFDEEIISLDTNRMKIKGLTKGQTDLIATFKSVESGAEVDCVLPITVNLLAVDKSATVTLDALYLDESEYFIKPADVFTDISASVLSKFSIISIADVTSDTNAINIPVSNGKIDISSIIELGLTGNRLWQIDCEKYSYKVKVPIVNEYPHRPILNTYSSNNFDYIVNLKITKEMNDATNVVEFLDKQTNAVVDTGVFTVSKYSAKTNSGYITFEMDKKVAGSSFTGFYYNVENSYQLCIKDGDSYVALVNKVENQVEKLIGTFSSSSWGVKVSLFEDGTCTFIGATVNDAGTYELTVSDFNTGKITLTLDNGFNGQKVFEGDYSYTKASASIGFTVNGAETPLKVLYKEQMSNEPYETLSGYYKSFSSPSIYLGAEGKVVFNCDKFDSKINTVGSYELENGKITINLETAYNNQNILAGTYTIDGDLITIKLVIGDSEYTYDKKVG